jgi:uncharacterized coiled-coil DUF342 family protein
MMDSISEIRTMLALITQTLNKLATAIETQATSRSLCESCLRSINYLEERVKRLEDGT